jgi:WD40 repeat protein
LFHQKITQNSNNFPEYGSDFNFGTHIPSLLFEHEEHRYIIGGGDDGKISIWTQNNLQYEFLSSFPAHELSINFVCILENLNQLATASNDETIKIWDASDILNNELNLLQIIQGDSLSEIKILCYSTDLECLVSGSSNHEIRIWKREKTQNETKFVLISLLNEAHRREINFLIKLPNNYLASCSADCFIKIWQITREFTLEFQREMRHDRNVKCLMYLPESSYLISGSDDLTIRIWAYLNGQLLRTLTNQSRVCSLIWLRNNQFASGSCDDMIKIWTIEDAIENPLQILDGHSNHVLCMVKMNDQKLTSGSQDRSIKVWNLNDDNLNQSLETNPAIINSIVYFEHLIH